MVPDSQDAVGRMREIAWVETDGEFAQTPADRWASINPCDNLLLKSLGAVVLLLHASDQEQLRSYVWPLPSIT